MSISRKAADAPRELAQRMFSHQLFRRMLARQAIPPSAFLSDSAEAMLYRALDRCAHCNEKAFCRAWLAGSAPKASYVRFCPNSETIEAIRIAAP